MAETAVGRGETPGPSQDELPASDASPSADAQFAELRQLLVGQERRDLRALEARVFDGAAQTREVSRVLPEALTLRGHDPKLAAALAPTIEEAITSSVQRDPRPLADALFPVMGPAIRKAIEHLLASMMESFNRSVEQSLSWRALQWRLTAWRTGKPFAEIVLLNTLQYRVEQLLLIHAETGLLLQHVSASGGEVQDADQVSAMLTAIRDFVHDSFKVEGSESLDAFRVGDLVVTVEQGPFAVLAGVVRGTAPHRVRVMFREALESIHLLLGTELRGFQGDSAPFARARPALEACLVSELREPKQPPSYRRWIAVAMLVLAALGAWTFVVVRERQRWQRYLDRLAAEPGIVVLSSGRRGGRFFVTGLRDSLATDPASFMAAAQVNPESVDARWEAYDGRYPSFVVARATALLRPPAGVSLEYRDGLLRARGPAPPRWLIESERLALAVAGVRRFEYVGTPAIQQLTEKLEAVSILFAKGQSVLSPAQLERVSAVSALLAELNDALRVRGESANIEIQGHTDSDGSSLANGPLSEARAVTVRRLVSSPALDAVSFTARGVGSTAPLTAGATEAEQELNRRASLHVVVSDQPSSGNRP